MNSFYSKQKKSVRNVKKTTLQLLKKSEKYGIINICWWSRRCWHTFFVSLL